MLVINTLVILVFFFTLGYSFYHSPKRTFYNLYLPFLLLLPMTFRADIIGLPDMSLAETAISVAALCFIFTGMRGYKITFLDILLAIYGIFIIFSEIYSEANISYVTRVFLDVFLQVFFPYMLAKTYVGIQREEIRFSKRFVFLVFIIAMTLPYEIRMMASPVKQILSRIYDFPPENELVIRYGFKRFEGVYTHAILAGIILSTSFLLNTWLTKNRLWKRLYHPILKFYPYFISFMLFAGVFFTFARAPLYSLILSLSLVYAGFTTDKFKTWIFASVGSVLAAAFVYQLISPYFAENLTVIQGSEDWNTFTYRIELFNNYSPFVPIHPFLGWGSAGYPPVQNFPSVDNYYLLMALENGLIALGLFIAMIVITIVRLLNAGFMTHTKYERSLRFVLAGILIMIFLTISTVYLGDQTQNVLFLILGWSQGLLIRKYKEAS